MSSDPWHTTAAPAPTKVICPNCNKPANDSQTGPRTCVDENGKPHWHYQVDAEPATAAPADPVATEGNSAREWTLKTLAQFKGGAMTVTEQNGDVALTTFVGINGQRYLLSELLEAYAAPLRQNLEIAEQERERNLHSYDMAVLDGQNAERRLIKELEDVRVKLYGETERASAAEANVSAQAQRIAELEKRYEHAVGCMNRSCPTCNEWAKEIDAKHKAADDAKYKAVQLAESALVTDGDAKGKQ